MTSSAVSLSLHSSRRRYLYCALDLRDRRWIDSLTDERAKELAERVRELLRGKPTRTVFLDASGEYPGWR